MGGTLNSTYCIQAPSGRMSWTLQLLADELIRLNVVEQISSVTVYNTLKKNELKAWLTKE